MDLFILFGVSGDLSRKKIIPAFYELFKQGKLRDTRILGVSRRDLSPEYILQEVKPHIKNVEDKKLQEFKENLDYFQLTFSDKEKYSELASYIENIEKKHRIKDKIFYISTSPEFYEPIIEALGNNNISRNSKIIIEKPFGEDTDSASKLNMLLKKYFSDENIFRMDHYLGKKSIHELEKLREPEKLQIIFIEPFGIGTRGEYYNKFGALKDVFQNHILQLAAITLAKKEAEKIFILKKLSIEKIICGQYNEYLKEDKIPQHSKTETFVAIKMIYENIPIYILAGKKLSKKKSAVIIQRSNKETEIDFTNDYFPAEPYVHLIADVFSGKQTYFVSEEEIEEQWKIVEKLALMKPKIIKYDHEIPTEAKKLIEDDGWEWRI
ncbi:hypothetical protein J4456_02160 [Candidatus Pacearchaeota archaeon]|nr:hypothetical protein [Candidatus Pacearchaeota archaeon]